MTAVATMSPRAFVVWFSQLTRWDVKNFSTHLLSEFPFVPLGEFVTERSERIRPYEQPDETFRILGVSNEHGVFHAYDTLGKKINQPYQRVLADDFFYNPYRVNIGSIGLVPAHLGENYVSPAYVVFKVDPAQCDPHYLELVMRSSWFNPTLRAQTAGSVRQNLTFDLLCNLEVPLPPLPVQRKIVAAWDAARKDAAATAEKIAQLERDIEARFLTDLGLKAPALTTLPKGFSVRWRYLLRWSVSYNQQAQAGMDLSRSKYPLASVGAVAVMIQYGTSEKANATGDGTPVIRMNNLVNGELDLRNLKHLRLSAADTARLTLMDGDILFNRTNSKELVGKCAVFHAQGKYVFASYLIRVRTDTSRADPDFVAYALNCPIGRQQIDALSRQIIGQANVNSEELRSLQFPMPSASVQRQIVERIAARRAEIAKLKTEAKAAMEAAKADVEAMILGTKPVA